MSEKHIEIKIGQDPPHTTDFTAIVDVETGGRLFYEEVFPKHAERFVKCWNSHDALLAACKAFKLRIAYIGLPSEPMSGPNVPDWKNEIAMLEAAIALAEKEE